MLVSDYDNTFYTSSHQIRLNVEAVKKFRNKGNKFVLTTARDFNSIKEEINKYSIPYDYLNCYNGLVTYNSNDSLINTKYFDGDNLKYIKQLINKYNLIKEIMIFNEKGFVCSIKNTKESQNIIEKENMNFKNIVALKIIPKNLFKLCEITAYIRENMENIKIDETPLSFTVYPKCNKVNGIDFIKQIEKVNEKDIYTVGDDSSDLEMIEKYNGYNMLISNLELYTVSKGTCTSVKQLIKKIDK